MIQQLPFLRLSLIDASDSAAGVHAWMRAGTTVAEAESAAPSLIAPIAALSDAVIQSWHVVYRGAEEPRPIPPGTAAVAGAGVFVFVCDAPDTYAIAYVPGFRSDLLLTTGPGAGIAIDLAAPEVDSFVASMISGIFCNPFGVQLLTLDAAFYQWRP